jgi:hypothetical protein
MCLPGDHNDSLSSQNFVLFKYSVSVLNAEGDGLMSFFPR